MNKKMKNWKVKIEGEMSFLFGKEKPKYYDSKDASMQGMKKNLPHGGIYSQSVHARLYERIGLFRWKHRGCYIRDTKYYNENGEDLAEPLDNIVLVCKHVKEHCDKNTNNQMFLIRAKWLHSPRCNSCQIKRNIM